jgi:hypothetical protein
MGLFALGLGLAGQVYGAQFRGPSSAAVAVPVAPAAIQDAPVSQQRKVAAADPSSGDTPPKFSKSARRRERQRKAKARDEAAAAAAASGASLQDQQALPPATANDEKEDEDMADVPDSLASSRHAPEPVRRPMPEPPTRGVQELSINDIVIDVNLRDPVGGENGGVVVGGLVEEGLGGVAEKEEKKEEAGIDSEEEEKSDWEDEFVESYFKNLD